MAVAAVILLAGCGGSRDTDYRKAEGIVWATTYHITYRSPLDLDDSLQIVFRQVEESLSPFDPTSTVSRINRGESAITDTMFRHIFNASCQVNAISHGAFDPTVAPLVNLWGFGYREHGGEPTDAQIDSALQLVGIDRCHLDKDKLVKQHPGIEFNFSAITKGYGCDMIGEMLRRNGCTDYMVEIGGEVAVSGSNPHGTPWRIMIDSPDESNREVRHRRLAVAEITDCGVATSGNYRNYRDTGSGKAWHTISPVTGRPAITTTVSATVVAPSAMLADALATACMAMPLDSAKAMIERLPGTSALLVERRDSSLQVTITPGFPI